MKNPLLRKIFRRIAVSGQVTVATTAWINWTSRIWSQNGLSIGDYVYIGKHCIIEVDGHIGTGVMIGNRVGIIGRRDHDVRHLGALAPFAPWIGDGLYVADNNTVTIADDVWIGYGATILSGVTIGKGAVVGAGAVVAKDVEPYAIVGGNPARTLAMRFDAGQIVEHERLLVETAGKGTHGARHHIL